MGIAHSLPKFKVIVSYISVFVEYLGKIPISERNIRRAIGISFECHRHEYCFILWRPLGDINIWRFYSWWLNETICDDNVITCKFLWSHQHEEHHTQSHFTVGFYRHFCFMDGNNFWNVMGVELVFFSPSQHLSWCNLWVYSGGAVVKATISTDRDM